MSQVTLIDERYKDRVLTLVELLYNNGATGGVNTNEVQTGAAGPTPATSGSFMINFEGFLTAPIPWNATAAAILAALVALPNLNTGDVTVTGTAPAFVVTFGGTRASAPQALMTIQNDGLVPSGTATIVVTRTTPGASAVPAIAALVLDSRGVTFSDTIATISTEGTTVIYRKDITDEYTVGLENQVFQYALRKAMSTRLVTAGIGAEVERSYYEGQPAGGNWGIRLTYETTNIQTGNVVHFQRTFPLMQPRRYQDMDASARRAVPAQRTDFVSIKSELDLLGNQLPGVPVGSGGVFFYDSKLST
jgi:hypothetical protein